MTLGYDISDVSHTVYESTSSMSKRSPTPSFPVCEQLSAE